MWPGNAVRTRSASPQTKNNAGVSDEPKPIVIQPEYDHLALHSKRNGNRSRVGVVICELDGKETDLDSDWRIGHDIGHVVTEIFLPTAHSA